MSGGQQPVTQQTTQTRDPWIGAQPALNQVQAMASGLVNADQGYQPYTGQTQAALTPGLEQGIGAGQSLAQSTLGGTPGVLAGSNLGTNVINAQGITPGIQGGISALGQGIQQYGSLYGEAANQRNPYLEDILATNNRRIGDRINAAMSGAGRYGSGQHTDVMARALAESSDPILAQDYQARQAQRMAATQGLGAAGQTLADLYGQGLQRAGQWAQLAPTLDQARYQPAQQLSQYGEYLMNRDQQLINDQMQLWAQQQARPWEQVARYSAIAAGAGGLGGNQVTTQQIPQPSLLQSGLGGALAGAGVGSMFGAPGAAVGGLGGGLLGLLR